MEFFENSVLLENPLIIFIYIISHIYDYLTYPIWYFVQKPWRVCLDLQCASQPLLLTEKQLGKPCANPCYTLP